MKKTARYHYTEGGLDNIYLADGFRFVDAPPGRQVVIRNLDALHDAIGRLLVERKDSLSGKEVRFLRHEMLMSQAALARLLQVSEQAVHRWERGKSALPKPAEALIRLLYRERRHGRDRAPLAERLDRLAGIESGLDGAAIVLRQADKAWRLAA